MHLSIELRFSIVLHRMVNFLIEADTIFLTLNKSLYDWDSLIIDRFKWKKIRLNLGNITCWLATARSSLKLCLTLQAVSTWWSRLLSSIWNLAIFPLRISITVPSPSWLPTILSSNRSESPGSVRPASGTSSARSSPPGAPIFFSSAISLSISVPQSNLGPLMLVLSSFPSEATAVPLASTSSAVPLGSPALRSSSAAKSSTTCPLIPAFP